jgi:hypothetical protein
MRRLLPAIALSGALLVGGCQYPDGSVDWGNTLLLGAGVGAATALVAGAASNNRPRYYSSGYGHRRPYYGHGYGHHRGYRSW